MTTRPLPPPEQARRRGLAWAVGLVCFALGAILTGVWQKGSSPTEPTSARVTPPSPQDPASGSAPLPLSPPQSEPLQPEPPQASAQSPTQADEQADVGEQARQMMRDFLEEQMEIPEVTSMGANQITRRDDKTHIYYDVPITGLQKQDLHIQVGDGMITVSGKIQNEDLFSSFRKSFPIPEGVDPEKVKITPHEEKLVIELPKRTPSP